MSSKWNGGNHPTNAGSSRGRGVSVDQLSQNVSDISLDSKNGEWEAARKSKDKSGNAGKPWGQQPENLPNAWGQQPANPPNAWGNPDAVQKLGMGSGKGRGNTRPVAPQPAPQVDARRSAGRGNSRPVAPQPAFRPPLEYGWKWSTTAAAAAASAAASVHVSEETILNSPSAGFEDDNSDADSDIINDSDDDLASDGFDSDESQKSHETRKKNRWLAVFFATLDKCSKEEVNETARQWHCPACHSGPGAIFWYRGLQALITHAKTKGSIRVKLHRELAELLDEELRRRGTSIVPAGEAFGKWRGLSKETQKDREIVWPPMVIVMNTVLEKDDNDKWIGMGNPELLEYFKEYAAVKARHSYGPQGHRGMSVLIFESSAMGYIEADRLTTHFIEQGTDREAWGRNPVRFYPGGKRQLYGFMAEKGDLDNFNQHCQGKTKLKYELQSYQEMVVKQTRQMNEDNQQLVWFKNKLAKEQMRSKGLEESLGIVSEKLQKTREENRIVKLRFKKHHEETKEEMIYQEQFFNDQMKMIHETREELESKFEKMLQEQRQKVKQSSNSPNSSSIVGDEITKFIKTQDKEMKEFETERENLIRSHDEKKNEMKKKHWEEEVALENMFDSELNLLMEKYTPAMVK
ncbi:protein SUPPRESSOR OF GENE SILENCING 3-like [Impatiens glandulifera]|uniref:protein SUPPRESSOR OF GENE SILENCING 3-like n=1 Tax=Impatiens glandulifera TaxID=253017 RepID=UPI001FB0978C|nr:protein SUPPRESSOR OF GENE SILENCING 3-like [Impatiens glandulifera]